MEPRLVVSEIPTYQRRNSTDRGIPAASISARPNKRKAVVEEVYEEVEGEAVGNGSTKKRRIGCNKPETTNEEKTKTDTKKARNATRSRA